MFGSWKELVKLVFRTDTQEVELQPHQATTYTATRTISLPPGDANQTVVSEAATQTLTNKSIDADANTLTNIANAAIKSAAGIDATKIAGGTVSNTEFGYLDGVTSGIQTQIDGKASSSDLTTHTGASSGVHGVTGSVVGTSDTQTLTNKTIDADLNTISNIENADIKAAAAIDATKIADGSVDNTEFQKLGTAGTAGAGNLVTTDGTQSLTNKNLVDSSTFIVDSSDPTVKIGLYANGAAGTTTEIVAIQTSNRTITLPDATTTLVGTNTSQNLSGKNFTDSPSFDVGLTLDHTTTPTTPTGAVKIYAKSDNKVYKKDANGVESEIGSGSGQGSLNIVDNSSASSDTTGWTAATNYTVSRDTSNSPLAGIIDTAFAISTTTASTESSTSGVYAASLASPVSFRNAKLQLSMYVTVPASSLGVWRVSVYNSSGTRLSLSTDSSGATTLPAGFSGRFAAAFDSDSGATYTVSITQTTRTSANTLYATNISIDNGDITQGAALGPRISYTPNASVNAGIGTLSNVDLWYQRCGEFMIIGGRFQSGTVSGVEARLAIPDGFTIGGTTSATYHVGSWVFSNGTANSYKRGVWLATQGQNYLKISTDDRVDSTNPFTPQNGNAATFGSANTVGILGTVVIPIAEWTGNGTINLAQNNVEFAANNGTWDAAATASTTVYGTQGAIMGGALTASRSKVVRFQTPIQATDSLVLEIQRSTGEWVPAATLNPYSSQNTAEYGVLLSGVAGNDTDVNVIFSRYRWGGTTFGGAGTSWPSDEYWRVKKISSGQAVGFGIAASGNSGLIPYYNNTTLTANQDFTSGSIKITRIGNVVTVNADILSHASNSAPSTTNSFLPTWATPSSDQRSVVNVMAASASINMNVTSGGSVSFSYYSANGTQVARTGTISGASITYIV